MDGASGLAWAFSRKELHVWRYADGAEAIVSTRTLPYPSSRRHLVSLVAAEVRRMLVTMRPSSTYHMHNNLTLGSHLNDSMLCNIILTTLHASIRLSHAHLFHTALCGGRRTLVAPPDIVGWQGGRGPLAVIQCSEDGNIAIWPDFCGSDVLATLRVAGGGTVAALAAAPRQPGGGASPGAFLAYAGTADGALHRIEGTPGDGGELKATIGVVSQYTQAAPGQQVIFVS